MQTRNKTEATKNKFIMTRERTFPELIKNTKLPLISPKIFLGKQAKQTFLKILFPTMTNYRSIKLNNKYTLEAD